VKIKPLVPSERAERDVDEAIAHYLREAGVLVALAFADAVERTYEHIRRHGASGSSRYAIALGKPGLRSWPVRSHPYLVLYKESQDRIDVRRVLHGHRDIPASLQEEL